MEMKKVALTFVFLLLVAMALPSITTAHTSCDPYVVQLIAGGGNPKSAIIVGEVRVWNDADYLYVKYVITEPDWCLTETHLHVAMSLEDIPQKNGNPIPGHFDYSEEHECISEYTYEIPLTWDTCTDLYIAAHAVVMDASCYQTAILYGIERYNGKLYEVDVLAGTSTEIYDNIPPPPEGSATPNGLAYDGVNGRFYYTNYQNTPYTLYFWEAATNTEYVAGYIAGHVAGADFWDGKYYYITGPPSTDDLWEVEFNPDGTIASNTKVDDIANNEHGWTFNGDIAVKDGVVYGWGLCGMSGHGYEFFTYEIATGTFSFVKPSFQQSLQLTFGSNGVLYGHRSGGAGAFYVVDTTTGGVTLVTPTPSPIRLYTDCASGMICEPIIETAWGAGVDFPGKNWATYFCYHVQGVEMPEVWPEGGTLSVAYEDLPIGGGNDWDYNDFVVDIDTLATFWGTSTDRKLIQIDFTVRPEAKVAGYTHVMHLDADVFTCDGTYELYRDGSLVASGVYDHSTGIDVVLVPNTGSPPSEVILTIYFDPGCEFSFPTWDHNLYHGENLFYDPYLYVIDTGQDIHTGDVRMLTVPVDWTWPMPDGNAIWNIYPKVTAGTPPTFVPYWWTP